MVCSKLKLLTEEIRTCTHCVDKLPFEPNPIVRPSSQAKILIIGPAPGIKVHQTSISWNDTSGNTLREWMGIARDVFYDDNRIAVMPMGFCYPGKGKSGDLPPTPACTPMWHSTLLGLMPRIELTLLIGMYAQKYYLQSVKKKNLTDTVREWKLYSPRFLPMPHPSPCNKMWLKKNPWFELEVVPVLRKKIMKLVK